MESDISKKLKELRMRKRMSQQDVSRFVGITRSTISNYEVGRRTPHLKDLQRYCDAFGVGLDYFGITAKDEAFNLLMRAREVFENPDVPNETKEELYHEFMRLYLQIKDGAK